MSPSWLRIAVDMPDEDLDDLAPPPEPEAPEPETEDDLPPWHHPDPWTMAQAEEAFWSRVEELAHD